MVLAHLSAVVAYLTILLIIAGALLALSVVALAGDFLIRNHAVRLRRHQSVPSYYRHLVLGH